MLEIKLDEPIESFGLEKPFPEEKSAGQSTPLAFRQLGGRIKWRLSKTKPEDSKEVGVRNIQGLFLERYPRFNKAFPRGGDGLISEDSLDKARAFILREIGMTSQFFKVFGQSPSQRAITPYFEGSHLKAIKEGFGPWGIKFDDIDSITDLHPIVKGAQRLGKEPEEWLTAHAFYREKGISRDMVLPYLQDCRKKVIYKEEGRLVTLYHIADLEAQLNDILSLPKVDVQTGLFTNKEGEWAVAKWLKDDLGVSQSGIKPHLSHISSIVGRDKCGRKVTLYNVSDARKIFATYTDKPKVDKESRCYKDQQGNIWVYERWLRNNYGLSREGLALYLSAAISIEGRDPMGRPTLLYNLKSIVTQLEERLAQPKINHDTAQYTDSEGQGWACKRWFRDRSGINGCIFNRFTKGVSNIEGHDRQGRRVVLYNITEVTTACEKFFAKPQSDDGSRIYTDIEGQEWAPARYIQDTFGVNIFTLRRYKTKGTIRSLDGRAKGGREALLYNLSDLEDILQKRTKTYESQKLQICISPEEAEEEFKRIMGI